METETMKFGNHLLCHSERCVQHNRRILKHVCRCHGLRTGCLSADRLCRSQGSGDPSLNFTTEVSTAEVEQFGNYNVTSQVTVKDGRITDVSLAGNDFKGTHADDNQMYLNKAINGLGSTKGMKEKLTGL